MSHWPETGERRLGKNGGVSRKVPCVTCSKEGTNSLGCVQMQRQGADGALLVVLVDADVVIVEV